MSDDTFYDAVNATLRWEGGYVRDPDDRGGETNFGITKASYPDVNIAHLTRQDAITIYKRDYWDPYHFDQLPPSIAAKVFDLGVNMGPRTAIRLMQRAAGASSNIGTFRADGRIGEMTLAAVRSIDEAALLDQIRAQAAAYYERIAVNHPVMRKFLKGWLRRAAA